ncbi:hypothetical protein PTE30175_02526 [Pandoraea terrae]|uniref:Glyoxalase n=1 Tax=Pandoraea terrae TaxID=1537710 RepID=A0A5E4VDG1_9BURK|nr:hypothetical protein [Pandoraea terrae]VVE10328.1 hypothetical protein PTE30175_02526 [Pandoraea terrae]
MIQVDHVGIAARDVKSSAYHLDEILGIGKPIVGGVNGDMYRLNFGHGTFVLFNPAEATSVSYRPLKW